MNISIKTLKVGEQTYNDITASFTNVKDYKSDMTIYGKDGKKLMTVNGVYPKSYNQEIKNEEIEMTISFCVS